MAVLVIPRPVSLVGLVAAASLTISAGLVASSMQAPAPPPPTTVSPAAATPPAPRVTAPPPGAPAPGSVCSGCGVAPEPIEFENREGWTSIFDGRTLQNWDGNPEVWKVEDGAITAETWPDRRVGTTFLLWRGGEPGDFELKLDVKADYDIHAGIFYRSLIGPNVARAGGPGPGAPGAGGRAAGAAAAGAPGAGRAGGTPGAVGTGPARPPQAPMAVPSDPKWTARGYSMDWDYDPGNNGNIQDPGAGRTDTQIVWRGYVARTEAGKRPRTIGTLGDRGDLMKFIRIGDWNQVHIIAQGHQLTHIVNGHVMAILIDDDAAAYKAKGLIALQVEQFGMGKVHFRNIWLKQ